jgi:N-acetylmuramoyl-L-alanine amidase
MRKTKPTRVIFAMGFGLLLAIPLDLATAQVICIDAGHGGSDSGNATYRPDYAESNVNLQILNIIKDTIDFWGPFLGMSAVYTRTTDIFHTVTNRARIANRYSADAFISIHHNSIDTSKHPWYSGQYAVAAGGPSMRNCSVSL